MTVAALDALREPLGSPCSCGETEAHEHAHMWRTPKRWAVRISDLWQSASGVWFVAVGQPRYVRTEAQARELVERHHRRHVPHDFHWSTER